jgi:hypothetical protein
VDPTNRCRSALTAQVSWLAAGGWRTDTLARLGEPQANFGRLPDVPPDWQGGPDPTMATCLAVGSDTTKRWMFEAQAPVAVRAQLE